MGIILFLCFTSSMGQKSKVNPLQVVYLPDSIKLKLVQISYEGENDLNAETGLYIYNLQNRNDFVFKDGIYSFAGLGPHFPRRLFIEYNNRTFIFKKSGAFESLGVLEEYLECTKLLHIPESNMIMYLKVICNYLQEESDLTYGSEITDIKPK